MIRPPAARFPFDERGGLVVLVDPGRTRPSEVRTLGARAADAGACGFLIGDSLGRGGDLSEHVAALRDSAPAAPVVQFPASAVELSAEVDAILFLALLSGRNARYLIEEHVRAIPFFDRHPRMAAISTAYLLIDGGRTSAVEVVTGTRPLPPHDAALVAAHVRAGQLLGMRATYLEAGSGARRAVSPALVAAARAATAGPLFVGGGIATPADARAARAAGADYVVVGTLFERDPSADVHTLVTASRA